MSTSATTIERARFAVAGFFHRCGFIICDPIVFGLPTNGKPFAEDATDGADATALDEFACNLHHFIIERDPHSWATLTSCVLVAACETWLDGRGVEYADVDPDVGE